MTSCAKTFDQPLSVTGEIEINGAVKAGARVATGASLVVYGTLSGDVVVEDDAFLMVQGFFGGQLVRNDGLVMLFGYVQSCIDESSGNVVVGIDSVLYNGQSRRVLRRDGSTEGLAAGSDGGSWRSMDTNRVCVFDGKANAFKPLPCAPPVRPWSADVWS